MPLRINMMFYNLKSTTGLISWVRLIKSQMTKNVSINQKKTATWIWHFIILTLGRLSSDIIKLVFLDLLLVIDLQLGENVCNLIQHTPKVMFFLNYRSPSSYCMKFIKGICKPWVLRSAKGLYYVIQSNRMSHLSLSF